MAERWLFKTEPSAYSFEQLKQQKRTRWDGVKNALALKHLRSIRRGDEIFIYHTGNEKQVVGVARAGADAGVDHVDVAFVRGLSRPVTLAQIKAGAAFREFALVRLSRLSVMPVGADHWKEILRLSEQF